MKIAITGATSPLGRRVYQGLSPDHELIALVRPDEAQAWWATKGRALARSRRAESTPSGATLSRPVVERAV